MKVRKLILASSIAILLSSPIANAGSSKQNPPRAADSTPWYVFVLDYVGIEIKL